ncbi:MAG: hypothetical protein CL526_06190 [Aequorivita sp.]|nr:hypothetical protein [Aequorivita sp.]|tara:strand:- start:87630 stop:88883 length:1254 start_codon:yes stop_codon:yes gene_type:complete
MKVFKIIGSLFCIICLISCKTELKNTAEISPGAVLPVSTVINLKNPSEGNSSLPRLFAENDKLYMSWVEQKDSLSTLYFSVFQNNQWATPVNVNSGTNWFINWADFPAIAANNGNIIISYLQKSANGKYTYDAKVNLYSTATKTWKKNIVLHSDGTASEHGFVSIVPQGESSFYVAWLDGRNTTNNTNHEHHGSGAMTLHGRLVNADGSMLAEVQLDDRVCDCCQTAMTSVNGNPIIVYRDRSISEVRDISTINIVNKKSAPPKTVYNDAWEIAGCPVNGPAIASFKNNVVVAWFTAANEHPKVQLAFSKNQGKTFEKPIKINTLETLGRVDVVMASPNTAIVSWMENIADKTLLQVMKVYADGTKSFPVTVAETSFKRASGFPQIELIDKKLYVAWTAVNGNAKTIETAFISVENL